MDDSLIEKFNNYSNIINQKITPLLNNIFDGKDDVTCEASLYSLLAGGKRVRPCLMFAVAEMLGISEEKIMDFAVTLEMIHTYSLIHDDLPAMDNDDLRRGKPTCHKVYGEGIALLAGDNLLNRAAEILFEKCEENPQYISVARMIFNNSGINGMIGGQSIDLSSENKEISLDKLYELQEKKTGALLESAIMTSFCVAKVDDAVKENFKTEFALKELARHLGLAFQIKDDILDFESNSETLGKTVGKDDRDNKSTFVTLLGIMKAKDRLSDEISKCVEAVDDLMNIGYDVTTLRMIVNFLLVRDN